jgi:protein-tyrosine-phosphatase
MAAGFLRARSAGEVEVLSAGSDPADSVNPSAVAVMAEKGIDIGSDAPQRWTDGMIRGVDVVVTMGCGDECPVFPGVRYLDWDLDDPSGKSIDEVLPIRDAIEHRVLDLISELIPGV